MFRALHAEVLKLKASPMLWISAVGISFAPFLNAIVCATTASRGTPWTWERFTEQNVNLIALLLGTMLFGLLACYVFGREFVEGTAKHVFTLPLTRTAMVLAKFAVLFVWSMALGVVAFASSLPLGWIAGLGRLSTTVAAKALSDHLYVAILVYLAMPLTSLVALVGRGYLPPMVFAAFATLAGVVAMNSSKYVFIVPWSIPGAMVFGVKRGLVRWGNPLVVLALTFIAGVMLNIVYVETAQVDT